MPVFKNEVATQRALLVRDRCRPKFIILELDDGGDVIEVKVQCRLYNSDPNSEVPKEPITYRLRAGAQGFVSGFLAPLQVAVSALIRAGTHEDK